MGSDWGMSCVHLICTPTSTYQNLLLGRVPLNSIVGSTTGSYKKHVLVG